MSHTYQIVVQIKRDEYLACGVSGCEVDIFSYYPEITKESEGRGSQFLSTKLAYQPTDAEIAALILMSKAHEMGYPKIEK